MSWMDTMLNAGIAPATVAALGVKAGQPQLDVPPVDAGSEYPALGAQPSAPPVGPMNTRGGPVPAMIPVDKVGGAQLATDQPPAPVGGADFPSLQQVAQNPPPPVQPTPKDVQQARDSSEGAPTGASFIPGHMQLSSIENTREGGMPTPLADAYSKHEYGAAEHLNAADQASYQNNRVMADAEKAAGYDIRMDSVRRLREQHQLAAAQERDKYIQDNQARVQAAVADANRKVDPDDLWKGNTFGRVMAAIAVGLGQFGASLTHSENGALKIVDGAIRDNIDAQKTNIANARARIGDLHAEKLDKFAQLTDDDDRHEALMMLYLTQAKQHVVDWAKKMGIDQNAPQYQQMLAGMDARLANADKNVATNAFGKSTMKETQKYKEPVTTGTENGMPQPRENGLVTMPDGTTVKLPEDRAEKVVDQLTAMSKVKDLNTRAEALRQQYYATSILDGTKRAIIKKQLIDMAEQKASSLSVAEGQGTLRDKEKVDIMDKRIGYLDGLGEWHEKAGWTEPMAGPLLHQQREAADALNRSQNERYEKQAYSIVQDASGAVYEKGYAKDDKGHIVPTGRYTSQDLKPKSALKTPGFEAYDKDAYIPTAEKRSLGQRTERTQLDKGVVKTHPASTTGKKK